MDIKVSKIVAEQNSYQKQYIGNFFDLANLIEEIALHKNRQDIKILLYAGHGLADALGTLNVLLFIAVIQKQLTPSQIYFHKQQYTNFHEFVTFDQIHLLKHYPADESVFDIVIVGGYYAGLYWNHQAHFRNYVSYSNALTEEAVKHTRQYGVHFRFKHQELKERNIIKSEITPEDELSNYTKRFLKVFRTDCDYFLCSDCTVVNDYIDKFSNIHTIHKTQNQWSGVIRSKKHNRREDATSGVPNRKHPHGREDATAAMLDLAILSQCEVIYAGVDSGFPIAATLLSNKFIPLDQNIKTDCWPQSTIKDMCYKLGYLSAF